VRRVVQILNNIASDIIRWLIGLKLTASKEKFMHLGKTSMPNVIGAIDGSFIFIKKPNFEVFSLFLNI